MQEAETPVKGTEIIVPDVGEDVELPPALRQRINQFDLLKAEKNPMQALERIVEVGPKAMEAAVRMTLPQDWIQMGDKMYLQGIGCERGPAKVFGIKIIPPKNFAEHNHPDGTFSYSCTAVFFSTLTGQFEPVMGARWSGDEFFDRFDEQKPSWQEIKDMGAKAWLAWRMEHRLPIDRMDVMKAAETNCEVRGISKLSGIRGLTEADLARFGLKASSAVQYGKGSKGGKATSVSASGVPIVSFGKNKGKPITDLGEKSLLWYIETAKKNIEDPAKEKWRAREEKWLQDLLDEQQRRLDAEAGPDEAALRAEAAKADAEDPDGV